MDRIKSYFMVVGIYILFMLISIKYSPLSDAINDPDYHPVFDGEKWLDISISSVREMFKEDSVIIRRILIYGMQQYLDIFEYPYCTLDSDYNNNLNRWPQWLQFLVSFLLTGWLFFIFQRITGSVTNELCQSENGRAVGFVVKISYIFYIENIFGYIAQIAIYWMQKIVLSKPISAFLMLFYKLVLLLEKILPVFLDSNGNFHIIGMIIFFLISLVGSMFLAGILFSGIETLGGIEGAAKKYFGIFFGPYIMSGIQFFVYLLWVGLNSLLLNCFNSVILIKEIIHLRHFGILYFVFIVVIFWKDTIDPIVSNFLIFLFKEHIMFDNY